NDRPVALFQTVTNVEDSPLQILLSGSDMDGDSLTYSIVTPPDFGSLSGSPPFLVYRPVTNYFGGDRLWFRVNDGVTNSEANAVNMVLTPLRDVENVVTSIERLPNGQLQLTIRGEPYQEYVLETCQNLRDWHHLQNVTGTASGQMTITFGMGDVYRFYRARSAQ
ncbi:MAG TPA: Ig-like domain-containing protein, partial [Verrucomicrobiae bacterium]|nr:Ig-like domain-containing protein [Verrucomicrobiae bacterium]